MTHDDGPGRDMAGGAVQALQLWQGLRWRMGPNVAGAGENLHLRRRHLACRIAL